MLMIDLTISLCRIQSQVVLKGVCRRETRARPWPERMEDRYVILGARDFFVRLMAAWGNNRSR